MEPVFKHNNNPYHSNETEDIYMYEHPNELSQALLNIVTHAKDIPSEIIGDIFNPYFSTKKNKNGTELGLYFTKHLT